MLCAGYLPKPGLCPHPKELRVHLKGKIHWNFLQIKHRFPQKQKSNKIWERPRIVNPEIMEEVGGVSHKKENLLQEFHFWFCYQHWTDHFHSYFVSKSILHPLWFPWDLPCWHLALLGCLGQKILYPYSMGVVVATWNPFCSVFEQIKGSSPYLTRDNYDLRLCRNAVINL